MWYNCHVGIDILLFVNSAIGGDVMREPAMRQFVLTFEDGITLLHALVRYYQHCQTPIPDAGMLLISRLSATTAEIVQDEAQAALYPSDA